MPCPARPVTGTDTADASRLSRINANAVYSKCSAMRVGSPTGPVQLSKMLSGGGTADPGRRAESEQGCRKESAMKANVGDWLVIKGTTTERSDQRGLITEVHSADGSPPYVVRWLATGHVATVVPGPDAIVVTPEEQEAADERAQERAAHRGTND